MQQKKMGTFTGAHYFPMIKKTFIFSSMLLLLFFLHYFFLQPDPMGQDFEDSEGVRLLIRDGRTHEPLYSRFMDVEETFTLEYTHSVTNQPVYEFYRIYDDQQIELYEMTFQEFGANLPVGPELVDGVWTEFIVTDECYRIRYQGRLFDRLSLQVGTMIAHHTIEFANGERLPLLEILQDGNFIEMYLENSK